MSEDEKPVALLPQEGTKTNPPSEAGLSEAPSNAPAEDGGGQRSPKESQTRTSKSPTKGPMTSGTPSSPSKSIVDGSGRRHLNETLRREVSQHEQRLETASQRLQHAAQHLHALSQVSEKLRSVIEVEKKKSEDLITLKEDKEEEGKDEVSKTSSSQVRRGGKRTYNDVVTISLEHYRDFLSSTESLAEGILLLQAEGGFGDIARELRGAPMEEDLARWRRVIALLVKYDDHVRRAIDCFDRQAGQMKAEEQ